jgi:hypothetical protein
MNKLGVIESLLRLAESNVETFGAIVAQCCSGKAIRVNEVAFQSGNALSSASSSCPFSLFLFPFPPGLPSTFFPV